MITNDYLKTRLEYYRTKCSSSELTDSFVSGACFAIENLMCDLNSFKSVLKVSKVDESAKVPTKNYASDSGFDMYVHSFKKRWMVYHDRPEVLFDEGHVKNFDSIELFPNDRCLIGTGIRATIGEGWELQLRSRSGIGIREGLVVTQGIGTIDEQYRNEICVAITNISGDKRLIKVGDKICQIVPIRVELPTIEVVDDLGETARGMNGFGSTGK